MSGGGGWRRRRRRAAAAAAAGAAKGAAEILGAAGWEGVGDPVCGAPGALLFKPEGRYGVREREAGGDPDPAPRPLGPGALESPGRTPSPPKCIPVLERSGRAGLPGENLAREQAGAPRDRLGAPGTRSREGVGLRWGARVWPGSGPPPVPPLARAWRRESNG